MKFTTALLLSTLFVCGSAFAGDGSTFLDLGFSSGKTKYAFIEYGTQDGSGFPYAHVQVINVAQNKLIAGKEFILQTAGATESKAISKAKAFASAQGVNGGNLGTNLLINLPTDLSSKPNTIFTLNYLPETVDDEFLQRYQVDIHTTDIPGKQECMQYPSQLLRLSIIGRENTSGQTYLLQDDLALPGSRQCAHYYKVERVIRHGDHTVIIVRFQEVGFEGPNARMIAVTGVTHLE